MLLPLPLLSRYIIDRLIPEKNYLAIVIIALSIFIIYALQNVLVYWERNAIFRINRHAKIRFKLLLLRRISRIQDVLRKQFSSSYLSLRIRMDTEGIEPLFLNNILSIFQDVLIFFVGIIGMYTMSVKMSVVVLVTLVLYFITIMYFKKKLKTLAVQDAEAEANAGAITEECVRVSRTAALYQSTPFLFRRFLHAEKISFNVGKGYYKVNQQYTIVLALVSYLPYLLSLLMGAMLVIRGDLSLGSLMAYQSFIGYAFGPVQSMMSYFSSLQKAFASVERINEIMILDQEPLPLPAATCTRINSIEFRDVSFAYNEEKVLTQVNFRISKNERVAIVGATGAGKSTLTSLIMGLVQPTQGDILINGSVASQQDIVNQRRFIKYIEQDCSLINGTIEENVKMGFRAASADKINELINELDVLSSQEDVCRYDEEVGPNGNRVSGGQRQKICLARCLVSSPDIAIVDETTSNLDEETERFVLDILFESIPGIIMITHRTRNLCRFDRILQVKNKTVIESRGKEH